jgi:hypothetical protein
LAGLRTGSAGGDVDHGIDLLYHRSGLGRGWDCPESGTVCDRFRWSRHIRNIVDRVIMGICQDKKGSRAMAKEMTDKSIVDQIIEVWFAELESTKEFDASTIGRLKHLASSRTLKKHAQVTKAIKKLYSEMQR